ncbi:MAG: YeeE/YedE thiosulfate transporter family protein [Thermodesulfobacteriota bacterium]
MKRDSIGRMMLGLGTGTLFGFFLHKGRASEHHAITGQLRLEDSSVLKIMGTATAVGAVGTQLLTRSGLAESKIKPLNTGGILLGGALFGAGMAILGYCPGTNMAALGRGHKDAAAGAIGMFGGAMAFVKLYPYLKPIIQKGGMGKRTLPEITRTSPWLWAGAISAAMLLLPRPLEGSA